MNHLDLSSIRRSPFLGRRALLVLIAVLLTGVPHMAAAWSDGTIYDEDHTLRSVRRVLLLDKTTSSRFTITVHATRFANDTSTRLPSPVTHDRRAVHAAVRSLPQPRPWLSRIVRVLYRHDSNFT